MSKTVISSLDTGKLFGLRPTPSKDSNYGRRVLETRPGNLLCYLPLSETGGNVAHDISERELHGTCSNVTFQMNGIGDGLTSGGFVSSYINLLTTGVSAISGSGSGSILFWARAGLSTVWSIPGASHTIVRMLAATDTCTIGRSSLAINTMRIIFISGGGTNFTHDVTNFSPMQWFPVAVTWNVAQGKLVIYLYGINIRTRFGTMGNFGSLTTALIGAVSTTPTAPWIGNVAHFMYYNCELTADEIAYLSRPV